MFSKPDASAIGVLRNAGAHCDRVVARANATLRLLNGLGAGTEDIPVLVAEVNMSEQAADKIKSELIALLR